MPLENTRRIAENTRQAIKNTANHISKNINETKENIKSTARQIKSTAHQTAHQIKSTTQDMMDVENIKATSKKISEKVTQKADELAKDIKQKLIALAFIAFAGFCFWLLMELLYLFYGFNMIDWFQSLPYVYPTFKHVFDNIAANTRQGIMYFFSMASIFFFPVPMEILYIRYLRLGLSFEFLYPVVILGIIIGQHVNFFLGRFLGFLIKPFIKKRTRIGLMKRLHKYGTYGIIFMHLFPLPYPLFNFVVGLTRYNYFKWLITMIPALLVNYLVVYLIYLRFF